MGNFLVWVVWFVAAAACLGTGVAVVTMTNPFFSALALIGNLASLAVLFLLLSAEFLAAAQVLVYAGAVMVMFLSRSSPASKGSALRDGFAQDFVDACLPPRTCRPQLRKHVLVQPDRDALLDLRRVERWTADAASILAP